MGSLRTPRVKRAFATESPGGGTASCWLPLNTAAHSPSLLRLDYVSGSQFQFLPVSQMRNRDWKEVNEL